MALTRTWYTRGNIPAPDTSTATLLAKSVIWCMKAALKDEISTGTLGPEGALPAGAKWTCAGSSDSATANMTGTDLWTASFDATKIVRANGAVAHSWIVLQSPAALGPYYLLIDWNTASDQLLSIYASKTAFTGGTITARPTSTTEWTVLNAGTFAENVTNGHRITKTMDASGNFFFHTSKNSAALFNSTFWGLTATDLVAGELVPFFTAYQFSTGGRGAGTYSTLAALVTGRVADNSATMTAGGFGTWVFGATTFSGAQQANFLTGAWDTMPIYMGTMAPTLKHGVRGIMPDVGVVGAPPVGGSDPTTSTQERMVVGDVLIPSSVVPSL